MSGAGRTVAVDQEAGDSSGIDDGAPGQIAGAPGQ